MVNLKATVSQLNTSTEAYFFEQKMHFSKYKLLLVFEKPFAIYDAMF